MIKPKRNPILREDRVIEIHLTKGHVALIDWEDVWLCGFSWYALTTPSGHTYAARGDERDVVLLHREMFGLGRRDGFDVDHMDGNTLDCRRSNVRIVSHKENTQNRKIHHNNVSGVSGVRKTKNGSWSVSICGKYLGSYKSFESAKHIRLKAERELWGIQPQRREMHAVSDEELFPERLIKKSDVDKRSAYNPKIKLRKLTL